ncbi:histidine kinase N-terminal 7TM domain-containing protein [Methanoregula sp.]|uniref:histidine kinase N-terminal 7TM domain-containing protein n=1 Tax=Methanoregula sp. TaxID=2052170 RepID=UPI003561C9C5
MGLQFSPVLILFVLSLCITATLAIVSWRNWKTDIAPYFTLLMAAASLWTAGTIGEIMSTGLAERYFFVCLQYPGIVTVPVAWFFIVLHYMGGSRYLTKKTIPLFFIIPTLSVLLVLTNPLHHLYYTGFMPVIENGLVVWIFLHGPLFWIHVGYSYALSILGLALVISGFLTAYDLYRRQMALLLLACVIPAGANIVYVFSLGPFPGQDFTPLMFTLSGIIVAFGILKYRLFSLTPVAYSRVFRTITDGVVVTDSEGRIIEVNPAAETVFASPARVLVARNVDEFLPHGTTFSELCKRKPVSGPAEIAFNREEGTTLYYDTYCMPLNPDFPKKNGYLLILMDVTRRKRAETSLEDAHRKLSLMSNITRHDILNQITGVNCFLEMSATLATTREQAEYVEKEKQVTKKIEQQIEFAREYQNIGVEIPRWQEVTYVLSRVTCQTDTGPQIIVRVPPCEVYADPMLEKVFFNLISNARNYGETLTRITITGETDRKNFRIICEDDGVGISAEDKLRLFTRGFGKSTGLGLFLSREILSITGISITENSEPGKGARFVILVPAGTWRIPAA